MKSVTKEGTPQSEVEADQNARVTETSGSTNCQNGDDSNTTGERVLQEMNEQLANLLALYNKAGGKMTVAELPTEMFGSKFAILLPAEKQKDGTFTLIP